MSKWCQDDNGPTIVEYGIAVIVAVNVGTVGLLTFAIQIDNNMNSATTQMAAREAD
jgi:Flp pilus assembly pilin Flp